MKNDYVVKDGVLVDSKNTGIIEIPEGVTSLNYSFRNTDIVEVVFPSSLKEVDSCYFWECKKLVKITIKAEDFLIGSHAFFGCTNLKEVVVEGSIKEIQCQAFKHSKIEKINLPNGLKKLGVKAFEACSIKTITLPDTLEDIGYGCFSWNTKLETINLPSGITKIFPDTFEYCNNLKTIYVPKVVKNLGSLALNCKHAKIYVGRYYIYRNCFVSTEKPKIELFIDESNYLSVKSGNQYPNDIDKSLWFNDKENVFYVLSDDKELIKLAKSAFDKEFKIEDFDSFIHCDFFRNNENLFKVSSSIYEKNKVDNFYFETIVIISEDLRGDITKVNLSSRMVSQELKKSYYSSELNCFEITEFNKYISLFKEKIGISPLDSTEDENIIRRVMYGDYSEISKIAKIYGPVKGFMEMFGEKDFSLKIRKAYGDNYYVSFKSNKYTDDDLKNIIISIQEDRKIYKDSTNKYIDIDSVGSEKVKYIISSLFKEKIKFIDDLIVPEYLLKTSGLINDGGNVEKTHVKINTIDDSYLRSYQRETVEFLTEGLESKINCILDDENGLGKKVEVISFINRCDFEKPVLILTKSSLIYSWSNQLEKYYKGKYFVSDGTIQEKGKAVYAAIREKQCVVVAGYDYISSQFSIIKDVEFSYVVFDKEPSLFNHFSQKYEMASKIKCDASVAIYGDGFMNGLLDNYKLVSLLNPGFFMEEKKTFIYMWNRDISYKELIIHKLEKVIIRHCKSDVENELPSRLIYEEIIAPDLSQKQIYVKYRMKNREIFLKEGLCEKTILLINELRNIASDPNIADIRYNKISNKMKLCNKIIESKIIDRNVAIISCSEKIINNVLKINERFKYITKSNDFICLSTTDDLSIVDTIIDISPLFEKEYSFIGKNKNVEVYKLVSDDTIEFKFYELLKIKGVKSLADLSFEDIKKLFDI